MTTWPRIRTAIVAIVAIAGLTASAPASAASASGPAEGAKKAKSFPQTTCFWTDKVASKYSTDPAENYAFPDSGAVYWSSRLSIPEGAKVVLKGRYPHARYMSLNSYDGSNNAPTDALNDVSTKPDKGSKNPFKVGARRDTGGGKRHYTVRILNQELPAKKAKNTLYAGVAGQMEQQVALRVYEPDSFKEKELTGGVGLPKAKVRLADGSLRKGKAACEALQVVSGPLNITTLPAAVYESIRHPGGEAATFPAANPTVWRAFYSVQFSLACGYGGECGGNPERIGGQYSNIDNNYVSALGNRAFGEGPVWVLEGKLPKTQQTGRKVKRMPDGDMRYWSLCQNESLFTTIGEGCLYDSQVPVNKKDRYTIVTSLAADRPDNARKKCGVGFIPWPVRGDGAGNLDDSLLLLRNMLPASGFGRAIQDTRTPGDEAAVMGPYLPKGSYTTKAAFAKKGC